MGKFLRAAYALAALTVFMSTAGCVAAPPDTTNTTTTANTSVATGATPAASPTATPEALGSSETRLPLTLPVVDAMFADEQFAAELKSKLQLTDEQIEKLRAVAREETAALRETDTGEHGGTTSAATTRAAEKISGVIGQEKAGQFAAFVRERWNTGGEEASGGGDAAQAGKPNSVPTDTRIVVNAPAYRMDVFEGGKLVKSYKVGIGYPEFPLPTGLRKAGTIIFNPTWTPPDEPWVEGRYKPGQKVEAGSKLNPLGLIKIPIGLPSLIHGGKSQAKLGTFASHGCVGLTNAQVQDFAVVLAGLGGAELTKDEVTAYAKERNETKNVKLEKPVPVELRYETIVVQDGRLHIYRDVYDRGANTEENLRTVLEAHGVSFDQLSEEERAQVADALKEMARDAGGKPVGAEASPTPSPAKDQGKKSGDKVTRTIKGRKEVVIEIAALAGKGYPAPVGIEGEKKSTKPSAAPAEKRART